MTHECNRSKVRKMKQQKPKQINKAFKRLAVCGQCSKVNLYGHPSENDWIYMEKFNGQVINKNGTWFCSKKCQNTQIKFWKQMKQ